MESLSRIPTHYDVDFIIAQAGLTNHFGSAVKGNEIEFRYLVSDYDAVIEAIGAYPVAYRAVMIPDLLHQVSKVREDKIGRFVFNGLTIPLTLETKANLTGATVGLERNLNRASVNWSLGGGQFVTIPRATMFAMADAAFEHIQACFDAQKVIVEEIRDAADIEVLRQIDVNNHEAWPS